MTVFFRLQRTKKFIVVGDLFEKNALSRCRQFHDKSDEGNVAQDRICSRRIPYVFKRGYAENKLEPQKEFIADTITAAAKYETVLVFAGLTDYVESEGCDREHMQLPENQLAVIDALCKTEKR